jgi:hypothetical protein
LETKVIAHSVRAGLGIVSRPLRADTLRSTGTNERKQCARKRSEAERVGWPCPDVREDGGSAARNDQEPAATETFSSISAASSPTTRRFTDHRASAGAQHRGDFIGGEPRAILVGDAGGNVSGAAGGPEIRKQAVKRSGGPPGREALVIEPLSDTQPRQTLGIVGLVGQMSCAFPARMACPTVPMPPWCTMAAARGNTCECGA